MSTKKEDPKAPAAAAEEEHLLEDDDEFEEFPKEGESQIEPAPRAPVACVSPVLELYVMCA